jgi:hypothetical protein
MRDRDAAHVQWQPCLVQGAESLQIGQARAIAGGEHDRVDLFAFAVGPHDLVAVEPGEHRPPVEHPVRLRLDGLTP